MSNDADSLHDLKTTVYRNMRRMAGQFLAPGRNGDTLQPTALVHEAYLRLVDSSRVSWQGKTHFFAVSARQMRRILVDHARARNAQRRGGGARSTGQYASPLPWQP